MEIIIDTPKGKRKIGPRNPVFIVAEMSGNHNHNFENALKIIDAVAEAGADAIKLQTYTPDTLTLNCDNEFFQIKDGLWKGQTLHELYKKSYTPWEWQQKLKEYAESKGLIFFSTPFDETAVDFLEKINVPLYKVASFEITHIPLLKRIGKTQKPVILSKGLASKEEIKNAIRVLKESGTKDIAVLHCISSYPAKPEQMNLKTIPDIKERLGVISGISDHSLNITVPIVSAALGASIIEKHFTISREDGGPDSEFSIEPKELRDLIRTVREAESTLGKPLYHPESSEKNNIMFRRSLFASKDIKKGEIFTTDNIRIVRPGDGLAPSFYESILGKKAEEEIEKGTPLEWRMVENSQNKIFLRPAQKDDCLDIFNWRNDPVSVMFSPSGKIKFEEHEVWFNKKIEDPQTSIIVITNLKKEKVGMIRFDKDKKKAIVSINLNPKYRGKGLGKESLRLAIKKYFNNFDVEEIVAKIDPKNVVSQNLFFKLGFGKCDSSDDDSNKQMHTIFKREQIKWLK